MYAFKTNFLIRPPQGVKLCSVDEAGMPPCTICTVDIQTFRLHTIMHVTYSYTYLCMQGHVTYVCEHVRT
jgi:hypothetical protein